VASKSTEFVFPASKISTEKLAYDAGKIQFLQAYRKRTLPNSELLFPCGNNTVARPGKRHLKQLSDQAVNVAALDFPG